MSTYSVRGIAVGEIRDAAVERGLGRLSDRGLVQAVGEVLAEPRQGDPDSFVLHAPLELIARARLLPQVDTEHRELARLHILAIAAQYEAYEPAIDDAPAPDVTAQALLGDLPDQIIASTAAAGHASIYLAFLHELGADADRFANLARPLQQNLARQPDWRIRWLANRPLSREPTAAGPLADALANAPQLGAPASSFIHPLMMHVDESGVAADVLGQLVGVPTPESVRALLRVSALSMLHEPADEAKYGWTHCFTLPQAVLRLSPLLTHPSEAMAVAATQVLAYRCSFAQTTLDDRSLIRPVDPDELRHRVTKMTNVAATSHDAHLVKYTLAMITAADDDPGAADLYLSAGEFLQDVWARSGDPTDPLR